MINYYNKGFFKGNKMITISNIKLSINEDVDNIKDKITKKLRLKNKDIKYKILRESIDARKKDNLFFVYQVLVDIDEKNIDKNILSDKDVNLYKEEKQEILKKGNIKLTKPILVVGMGPAGLFCAYKLGLYGYNVSG